MRAIRWAQARALLERKAALTPHLCIAAPGAPFPWFEELDAVKEAAPR